MTSNILLGSSTGGAGFVLGPIQNAFEGATQAAARLARNTYANANADWLALYNADRSNYIALEDGDGATYQIQRRNSAGDGWEEVSGLVRGPRGPVGPEPSNADIDARIGNRSMTSLPTTYDDSSNQIEVTLAFVSSIGDQVVFIAPANLDQSFADLEILEGVTTRDLEDFDGNNVGASALTPGRVYSMIRLVNSWRILEALAAQMRITIKAAASDDGVLEQSEIDAGQSTSTGVLTIPDWPDGETRHVFVGVPIENDDITAIILGGFNQQGAFSRYGVDLDGYKWWVSNQAWDGGYGDIVIEFEVG